MNLIEALRTGKRLRRPLPKHQGTHEGRWMASTFVMEYLTCASAWRDHFKSNLIDSVDILADDWQVEE